jgi:DNA-binding TFAR19-related protein (PDSD5 family)
MNDDKHDDELERLKAKRLVEMQKNISIIKDQEQSEKNKTEKESKSPKDVLVSRLGYRGLEVLDNALYQFPEPTNIIITKLAELISSGEIDETIDGGKLLMIFRTLGLNIRMNTTINVEQDGKFVSLSEKLLNVKNENNNKSINSKEQSKDEI